MPENWLDKIGAEFDAQIMERNRLIRQRNHFLAEANKLQVQIDGMDKELADMKRALESVTNGK